LPNSLGYTTNSKE